MSRTIMDYPLNQPDDFVQFIANDFLVKEGFRQVNYKGETVWKHGYGVWVAPSYIKLQYGNGHLHLETWIRSFGEHSLDGAWGFAVKAYVRNQVNSLLALLCQPVSPVAPQPVYAGASVPPNPASAAQQPNYAGMPPQPNSDSQTGYVNPPTQPNPNLSAAAPPAPPYAPIPVQTHNPTGSATASLILGLVSILGLFTPIVGIVAGITAISTGVRGRVSTSKGMATAGITLGIIFLILSAIVWILNILLSLALI